jgi:hypothetical protein
MPGKLFEILKQAAATRDAGCSWMDFGDRQAQRGAADPEKKSTSAVQPPVSQRKATPADSAISLAEDEIVRQSSCQLDDADTAGLLERR